MEVGGRERRIYRREPRLGQVGGSTGQAEQTWVRVNQKARALAAANPELGRSDSRPGVASCLRVGRRPDDLLRSRHRLQETKGGFQHTFWCVTSQAMYVTEAAFGIHARAAGQVAGVEAEGVIAVRRRPHVPARPEQP